jgi:hypothetical protein
MQGEERIAKVRWEMKRRQGGEKFVYGESMEVSNILSCLESTQHMKCNRLPPMATKVIGLPNPCQGEAMKLK